MSGNGDEDKLEQGKNVPLDLAAKITTVKAALDGKGAPMVVAGQPLRNMRVLSQQGSGQGSVVTPTIISTNIVPQAILKQCECTFFLLSTILNYR